MGKKKDTLRPLEIALCVAPIVVEVLRIVLDKEATPRNMAVLAGVALFGLCALIGQKWAVRFAPAIFFMAMGEMLVFVVLTAAPMFYWAMMGVLVWAGAELALAKDVQRNLSSR